MGGGIGGGGVAEGSMGGGPTGPPWLEGKSRLGTAFC